MPEASKTNFDLALEHLAEGSLAAQLVVAHINRNDKPSVAAMREVLQARLTTLKAAHAEPPAQ